MQSTARTIQNRLHIGAYAVLMDYAAQKRYGALNLTFPNDRTGTLAMDIHKTIAKKSGINIFQEEVSKEDIERYEDIVSTELDKYVSKHLPKPYETDEIEVLKRIVPLPSSYFQSLYIKTDEFLVATKQYNITFPKGAIESTVKEPDFIECIHFDNPTNVESTINNFYIVSKYTDSTRSSAVVAVISQNTNEKFGLLRFAIPVRNEQFVANIPTPSKLFFHLLNEIGLDITLGNETKRFFYCKILPPEMDTDYINKEFDRINRSLHLKQSHLICSYGRAQTAFIAAFVYAINLDKYKEMVKKHQI